MSRLTSTTQLKELRDILLHDSDAGKPSIVICAGTACHASGSKGVIRVAKRYLMERHLLDRISLRITGCHGFCEMGPFILAEPLDAFYTQVQLDDVPAIIEATLAGNVLEELLYKDPATGRRCLRRNDIPFFKHQQRHILGFSHSIDPIRINDYILNGGYLALGKVLDRAEPRWVIDQVKLSGLRGRGGAGFPTGAKWEMLAGEPGDHGKFVVCNADEGDPGAYMDRSVLEGNPQSVIEGMLIGAYATGATEGIVYARNEYPLAIKHLTIALRQAADLGLLGRNILGTDFSFDIKMARGAGAFVCGEETALIRSVEGRMGEPRQRPPFPVQRGIEGRPTVINNVETWANIPLILRIGADEFSRIGTKGSTGTKIFSLVGKIRNTGLVEVPMGMTIRRIVEDIGGGPVGRARIKAVQTGGPSGGCIPAGKFDLPIDYDSLAQAGSIMGSGGMIVMDEDTCMVDVAKYFMRFLKDESCGKCFTCRKGTQRMYELLDDISSGRGTPAHIDLLEELARTVKDTTMCGLGQTAANPVLSTLRYFRHEYLRHVVDKKCDALVCKQLVGAPCQATCPLGTEAWRYVALLEKGRFDEAYRVIRETNPFPSVCARVCDHRCESRCRLGTSGGQPLAIRALKRFVTDRAGTKAARPPRPAAARRNAPRVAVVGAGPAGLAAAHHLSMAGFPVTVFEAEAKPGGMLALAIPAYRLPREVLGREIEALLNENVTLKCGAALGRDFTVKGLMAEGFKAVFVSIGAHQSRRLDIPGEDAAGVLPSMTFLKAFNLQGQELARGRVGVVGGGNSAVDAARVALRQKGVESVTLLYRRTREEMPAFREEVEAALAEGVKLETLVAPQEVLSSKGQLAGVKLIRNRLDAADASGRARPVPVPGSEFDLPLDTLIVAISEHSDRQALSTAGLDHGRDGSLQVDGKTLLTCVPGVFAGGDVVTGPSTVVDAIAAGKRAAGAIARFLEGKDPAEQPSPNLPQVFVEPAAVAGGQAEEARRAIPPELAACERCSSLAEIEGTLPAEEAIREARRCLRCDLEFTQPKEAPEQPKVPAGAAAGETP